MSTIKSIRDNARIDFEKTLPLDLEFTKEDLLKKFLIKIEFSTGNAVCRGILCLMASQSPLSFKDNSKIIIDNSWLSRSNSKNYHHFFPKKFLTDNNIKNENSIINIVFIDDTLNKKEINLDLARQMIDKYVKNTTREISIDYIQKVVCDYFDLPLELINSKTRKREIVQARQLAMYFSKKHTKSSLATIGLYCGNKDHATVLHACRTVTNLLETDKQFRTYVDEIEKKIKM